MKTRMTASLSGCPAVAVLGVDGWRGAWVGALLDGRTVTLLTCRTSPPSSPSRTSSVVGDRHADRALGRRRPGLRRRRPGGCSAGAGSSVFPAPLRAGAATRRLRRGLRGLPRARPGRALSVQTWNLVPAIRALDDALGDPPPSGVRRGAPRAGVPRARRRASATARRAPAGLAQRMRALQPVMDVLDALADRAGRRARSSTRSTRARPRGRPGGSPTGTASASATAPATAAAARCGSAGEDPSRRSTSVEPHGDVSTGSRLGPVSRRTTDSGSTRSSRATGVHGHPGT